MTTMRPSKWSIATPPLLYLLVFFAIPTLIMVVASFRNPGEFGGLAPLLYRDASGWHADVNLESYARVLTDALYLELFVKSLWYAVLTTALCLVLGYPLALLIARSPKKHRDILVLLVILPFWSNFLIRVYAWLIILGPESVFLAPINQLLGVADVGPLSPLFTPFAVIVGMVYVHLPFMVLPLYANLEKHDPALLDAAQDLGANAFQRFWRVTFPLSLPGILAGSALVLIPAFGMFAIPDILGGTSGIMIGNVIKQQFLDTRDWPFGSVLSIVLTVIALALAGLAAGYARRARI